MQQQLQFEEKKEDGNGVGQSFEVVGRGKASR